MSNLIPEISRVTDFEYNTAIQIFGENFEENGKVYLWKPKNEIDIGAPFADVPVTPPDDARVFGIDYFLNQVIYINSGNKTGGGVQVVWVENSNGLSKPYIANRPKIFNQSLLTANVGDVFTLYGDNLGTSMRTKALLLVNLKSNEKHFLNSIFQSGSYEYTREKYVAEFLLTDNLESGEYKVYINSGTGGNLGWSEPVCLVIEPQKSSHTDFFRMQWNDTVNKNRRLPKEVKVINIKPSEDLFFDMSDTIQNAVNSLECGGIVRLTQGVYEIGKTVNLKPGVVLLGDGEKLTVIKASSVNGITEDWSNIEYAKLPGGAKSYANDWQPLHKKYNPAALVRLTSDSGVQGIGFEMGNGANIGILVASDSQKPVKDAFVNSCSVDAMYHNSFEDEKGFGNLCSGFMCVSSTENLVVFNSTFKAQMPVTILPAYNERMKFVRNYVECVPYQANESYFCGIFNSIIMCNTFANGRRSFMCQSGFVGNFVYQNRSTGVARSGNALEVYMSEYGDTVWFGKSEEIGENYIAVTDKKFSNVAGPEDFDTYNKVYPLYAVILDGKGFGQFSKVKCYKDGKFYFEKPFRVLPDSTTVFSVCSSTANNIWLNNNSEFSNGHSQFIWNCGVENIVAGHEINMAAGMQFFAHYGLNNNQRCFCVFNKVERCQVRGSGKGMFLRSQSWSGEVEEKFFTRTYGVFGNTIRHNAFGGCDGLQYVKNQNEWRESPYDAGIAISGGYNLTECNRIAGYHNGTHLVRECKGNYFAKNVYYGTPKRFAGCKAEIGPDKE